MGFEPVSHKHKQRKGMPPVAIPFVKFLVVNQTSKAIDFSRTAYELVGGMGGFSLWIDRKLQRIRIERNENGLFFLSKQRRMFIAGVFGDNEKIVFSRCNLESVDGGFEFSYEVEDGRGQMD